MKAKYLKILIIRNGEVVVDISMPAYSSKWIMELMPEDALKRITERNIDIVEIQNKINSSDELECQELFELETPEKKIRVWLA